ncbi:hypothetical protein D3C75_1160310 [compost metagenome]
MDDKLDVDQANGFQFFRNFDCNFYNLLFQILGQVLWRIYRDGVTRVHPCAFDMLHDSWNENRFTITDRVYLYLFTQHITVN